MPNVRELRVYAESSHSKDCSRCPRIRWLDGFSAEPYIVRVSGFRGLPNAPNAAW